MPPTHIHTLHRSHRPSFAARILMAFRTALTRRRDRQHLARLDTHLLRDIGLDPHAVRDECAKPFWQA